MSVEQVESTLSVGDATTSADQAGRAATSELQATAQKHLLMHFTAAAAYRETPPPVMVRGEGCWLIDEAGVRHFDALAGLYCVQIGYSYGAEIGAAVKQQLEELPYCTNWGRAHPASIQLAERVATLAPGPLERVFFTSGGSEANESAVKLVRQYHQARGEHSRMKFLSRWGAYHGTSYAALSINGMTKFRSAFEPLMHGALHFSNTKRYLRSVSETEAQFTDFLLRELEGLIVNEDPSTIAGLIIEPLQNSGGSLVPPTGYLSGVRGLCDKYGILLIADEVITGFGRLGEWFGCQHYGLQPDVITFAKGIGSAYAPLGGMIASSEVVDTVLAGPKHMYLHGITYGGHPAACATGLANLEIMAREDVLANVRENGPYLKDSLERLTAEPFVGDVRGDGYHYTIELVSDKVARAWTLDVSAKQFVDEHLAPAVAGRGVLCRVAVEPEGNPSIQIAPPLIMTRAEIDYLVNKLGDAVKTASDAVS